MKREFCKYCTYFTAYYTQMASLYTRTSNGWCAKGNMLQTQYQTCEEYKTNELKEIMREKKRFQDLDNALKFINDIAQILKEKEKENKPKK